ncbi:MAG: hypothetical protein QM820_15250 [Minicystis sp.]
MQGTFEPVVAAWSWEAPAAGRPVEMRDRFAARAWLARVAAGAGQMARLRRLVGDRLVVPAFGIDDGEVLDRLAGWLASGDLKLVAQERGHLTTWGDTGEEAPAPAWTPREAPVEEAPRSLEVQTFSDDIDAEAIAAGMREAARLGIPFCEECTRKKLRAERAARQPQETVA